MWYHKTKNVSISPSTQTGTLWPHNYKVWTRWVPWILRKERKEHICKFVSIYWTNMDLKVTVSSFASLPMMRCYVTTMSCSQNGSLWTGDIGVPYQKMFKRQPSVVKWCALSFGIGNGWSFVFPGTQTNNKLRLIYCNEEGSNFQSEAREEDNPFLATQ